MRVVFGLSSFMQVVLTLAIFIPLVLVWVFSLVELFRHREEHRGWHVALWLVLIVAFPFVGAISYLVYRGMHSTAMQDAVDYGEELDPMSPEDTARLNR